MDNNMISKIVTDVVSQIKNETNPLCITLEQAKRLAKKLGKGKCVVTVLPDTAERYFTTPLFKNE